MKFTELRNEKSMIKGIDKPKTVRDYEYTTDPTNLFPYSKFQAQKQKYINHKKKTAGKNKEDRKQIIQKMIEFDKY